MTARLKLLIDADLIVYRVGFAAKEDEPVEHTLHAVKSTIESILSHFPENNGYQLYLSGKGNFREEISTYRIYKGNRDPLHKPQHYQQIRDYLVNIWKAEVVEGQEADDALGIEQWANKDRSTCIVSTDKDLNMIPGWHYNWVQDNLFYVTLEEANNFFFKQVLTGDATDNIQGIPRVGDKKADKVLKGRLGNIDAMQSAVKTEYRKYYKDKADFAYSEMSNLIWIRREPEQRCPY